MIEGTLKAFYLGNLSWPVLCERLNPIAYNRTGYMLPPEDDFKSLNDMVWTVFNSELYTERVNMDDSFLRAFLVYKRKVKNPRKVLLTINFDDKKIEYAKLGSYLDILKKRKWFVNFTHSFEQRGETDDNIHGAHVHILFTDLYKKKSEIIREVYKSLKLYLGSEQSIDVRIITNDNGVDNYLIGIKSDPKKHKKQSIDIIFKSLYGL